MSTERFTLRPAVYLILEKGDKILLLRRANTGWMDGKYDVPAGHIDGNEPATNAVIREAKEEVGITLLAEDLEFATVTHRNSNNNLEYMDFYFSSRHWVGEPRINEPDKCDDLNWFLADNLPDNLVPYTRQAIENYKNKISFSEFGWE